MHQYCRLLHLHSEPHDTPGEPDLRKHQQVLGSSIESLDYACRVSLLNIVCSAGDIC